MALEPTVHDIDLQILIDRHHVRRSRRVPHDDDDVLCSMKNTRSSHTSCPSIHSAKKNTSSDMLLEEATHDDSQV